MLEKLDQHPPEVSPEEFHLWRTNPITKHFMLELEKHALDAVLSPLSLNTTIGTAEAYRADGKREMAEEFLDWTLLEESEDE